LYGSPKNRLSKKTNLSSSNPFSCKIHIFKVTLIVLYFLQKFENLQQFFMGEQWPWQGWARAAALRCALQLSTAASSAEAQGFGMR
jgi:hypothetical protein